MPAETTPEKPVVTGAPPAADTSKPAATETAKEKPKADTGFGTFQRAKRVEKEKAAEKPVEKEKKDEKAIADVPAKEAEKEKEKPVETEKKTVLKPKPKKEPVDLEKLVASTAAATVKALKPEPKPEKDQKPAIPKEDVPKRRQSEWDAIQKAEEGGASHKGSAAAAAEIFRAEDQYISQWEKDNPGKRFNSDADEHNEWYDKNLPEWVDEASDAGKDAIKSELMEKRILEKLEKDKVGPLKQELESLKGDKSTQQAIQEAVPRIHAGLEAVAEAIDPELVKVLKSGKTAEDHDPLAHAILTAASNQLGVKLVEQAKIWATGGKAFSNDNPVHKFIEKTHDELVGTEDADGLKLVPEWEYYGMSAAQKSDHRPIDADVMAQAITQIEVQLASAAYKQENDRLERMATAKGWTKTKSPDEVNGNGHAEEEEVVEDVEKPRSPSTPATTVIRPGAKAEAKVTLSGGDRLVSGLFTRHS